MEPVKIVSLELENVKRVALVELKPTATGLTVIGGDNAQGKTSVLDGIVYALGGEKYRPSNLKREGGVADARIELTLSNGLKVSRTGKNAALKVTDPSGAKAGQKLLDSFVEELAINLPKFLEMNGKAKAETLLGILGIGDKLGEIERMERKIYEERTIIGRVAEEKKALADSLDEHHDAPEDLVSAADVMAEIKAALDRNAAKAKARAENDEKQRRLMAACAEVDRLKIELAKAESAKRAAEYAESAVDADEPTEALEAKLTNIEQINAKVRANLTKRHAVDDAAEYAKKYAKLSEELDAIRRERLALLEGAKMPLDGLSVEGGELTYFGKAWDCMSGMERIRVGAAIVRELNPMCGFILLDRLEAFDRNELEDLGRWLEAVNLQAIATRVSKGDECTIIIEDGRVAAENNNTKKE